MSCGASEKGSVVGVRMSPWRGGYGLVVASARSPFARALRRERGRRRSRSESVWEWAGGMASKDGLRN